jgi:uncharacterized protein (TIGR03437 family)
MRVLLVLLILSVPGFAAPDTAFQWIERLGSGKDSYTGLGTDAAGNVYIVGNTESSDFPVRSPVQATLAAPNAHDVFIVKLDPSGNIVFATCFGGTGDDVASAVAVDPSGNIYVTGLTFSPDFPATSGAYRSTAPPSGSPGVSGASFILKLNSNGTIGYATYFSSSESKPQAIAVDSAGSAYLTGTSLGGLPVIPEAYRSVCDCGSFSNGFFSTFTLDGFLARFDPAGSKLLFATYLGVPASIGMTVGTAVSVAPDGSAYVGASSGVYRFSANGSTLLGHGSAKIAVEVMTPGPDGSLYLAGGAMRGADGFQPTAGAAQTDTGTLPDLPYQFRIEQQTAIAKLDGQLLTTLAATYFGGSYSTSILSLAADDSGNLFVGGSTAPRGLPTVAPLAQGFGSPSTGFAAELSGDLSSIVFSSYFGDTENFLLRSVAPGANGSLVLGGIAAEPNVTPMRGGVWINNVRIAPPPPLRVDSVRNAASNVGDPISAGETIVVTGNGFGSGAMLMIAGMPVNPMSVTSRKILAVVPAGLPTAAAEVQVVSEGRSSNAVLVPVAVASPGLFSVDGTGVGQGYILNQDGTLNTSDHPARPGERVTVYATGVGPVSFDQGYAVTANPVALYFEGFYARGVAALMGPIDGFPGDVYQLTMLVPSYEELTAMNPDLRTFRFPPRVGVVLTIAGRSSQNGLSIAIAP